MPPGSSQIEVPRPGNPVLFERVSHSKISSCHAGERMAVFVLQLRRPDEGWGVADVRPCRRSESCKDEEECVIAVQPGDRAQRTSIIEGL